MLHEDSSEPTKKKGEQAQQETLSDERELPFKPTEQNQCVIVEVQEVNMKARNKRER